MILATRLSAMTRFMHVASLALLLCVFDASPAAADAHTMKIYVGNLPFEATEDQVRDLFEDFGEIVSVAMITDRDTGRFRGFCFVEMSSGGREAIYALDGLEIMGRSLRVNEARPREERGDTPRSGDQGNRFDGDRERRW